MKIQNSGIWVVWIGLLLLTACGKKEPTQQLVMGTNAEFPPFELRGGADNSAIVGFDVEIAQVIAAEAGMRLQVLDMEFDQLLPALAEGKVDLVLAGLTITDERAELVDFSDSYYSSTQVVLNRAMDPVPASKESLRDQKVGAVGETTGAAAALDLAGEKNLVEYDSALAAVVGLMNSRVDFVVVDEQPAIHFEKKFKRDIRLTRLPFEKEFYGVAVQKGNTQRLAQVNAVLKEIGKDGRYDQFVDQWMVQMPEAAAVAVE